MSNQEIKSKLQEIYEESNLREDKCPLAKACSNSCEWESREKTPPVGSYVGEDYEKHRIFFVGINYNYDKLAKAAKKRNALFDYVGSYISRGKESESSGNIDGIVHSITKELVNKDSVLPTETAKLFAFTNIVKCSVKTGSGNPTVTMYENCVIRRAYIFSEIKILQPRIIVCVGVDPYNSIKSHFAEFVKVEVGLGNWLFRIERNGKKIFVMRAINPPFSGYGHIRKEWNLITRGTINEKWEVFFPECKSDREMIDNLKNKTFNEAVFKNPLYEHVIDYVVKIIRTEMQDQ